MDEHIDLDLVLFAGGNPPADGSFDPFLPGLGQEGAEDTGSERSDDGYFRDGYSAAGPNDGDNIIRYGRFGGEGDSQYEPNDNGPLPWQGAGDIPVLGEGERRGREAADAGNRNVRRTAEQHSGSIGPGVTGKSHAPRVDSSIASAAERIRSDLRVPLDARERSAAVLRWEQEGSKGNRKIKREYQKQGIDHPPQFHSVNFEAMLTGLKANVSGDWILTLVVPKDSKQAVYQLDDAFGLALDIHVQRHRMRPDE